MTCCYLDLGSASDWLKINFVSSNQKHYPDLASDKSSEWNFFPHSWEIDYLKVDGWRCEMSAVFSRHGFHWESSRSQSRNQKRRTLRTRENSVLILLIPLTTPLFTIKWKLGRHAECALWLVYPSASASDSDVSGVGRKWKRSDSSDSDSVALMTPLTSPIFLFSLGHKRSYDSAYDSNSDSIACENHPSD